ncbi:MAG: WxcM-like domain-containing protein [Candidatus Cloacimonetes bacterium]|nr:WxcM-like domain-containing protein [Candidatus Cloacimonadota bacterium]
MEKPILIKGDSVVDHRGKVSFVNDFDFKDIKRFYFSQNHQANFVRAWQCHKHEAKYFTVIQGTALICTVKIDNWNNPSKDLPIQEFIISAEKPTILRIPKGFANGIMNFSKDTKILIFATTTLSETSQDDIRLAPDYWNPWKKVVKSL